MLPKPYTKPHPPMWVAAGSPSTFEKAARMGLGVLCFTTGSPASLAPLIETYKREIKNAEPVGEYVNNNVMVTSQMLCLEDGQKARDIACNMTSGYHTSLVFRYLDTFPKPPGIPEWPNLIPDMTPEQMDGMIAAGLATIGTPDECAKTVQGYADIGADQTQLRHAVVDDAGRDRRRSRRNLRQVRHPPVRQGRHALHPTPTRGATRRVSPRLGARS